MKRNTGLIIPKIERPAILGGGIGEVRCFERPQDYHILLYKEPFYYNGLIFWFEEVPIRNEIVAKLHVERSYKFTELQDGEPFRIKRGVFVILMRNFGVAKMYVVQKTATY